MINTRAVIGVLLLYVSIVSYTDDHIFRIRDSTGDFMIGTLGQKGTVTYIHPDLNDTNFSFTVDDKQPRIVHRCKRRE